MLPPRAHEVGWLGSSGQDRTKDFVRSRSWHDRLSIYRILVGLESRMTISTGGGIPSSRLCAICLDNGFREGVVADLSPDVLGVLENRSSHIAAAETLGVISLR